MLTPELIELLGCPTCRGDRLLLRGDAGQISSAGTDCGMLSCPECHAEYAIDEGVPDLVPQGNLTSESWQLWKDHLKGFGARRGRYIDNLSAAQSRRWNAKLSAFLHFMQNGDGNLLDIGCGTGCLRNGLDSRRTTYIGIDPLPTPHVREFLFARAVAEALPFQRGTFSSIVVRSALDHFCDLDVFFAEAKRILTPHGRIYLEQSIMDNRLTGVARFLAHAAKDRLDDWRNRKHQEDAPKHMAEYTRGRLFDSLSREFEVVKLQEYNRNWYTPTQLFISLKVT